MWHGAKAALPGIAMWFAALLGTPSLASAYEDQATLGGQVGYAALLGDSTLSPNGLAFGVSGTYGLDDTWSLRGQAMYAYHPAGDEWHVGIAGVELLYMLDVLDWVPFFGVGAHGFMSVIDEHVEVDPAINLALGLDYHVQRSWVLGLDLRPFILPTELSDEPFYLTCTVRISWLLEV